jgi:hypothetical protein
MGGADRSVTSTVFVCRECKHHGRVQKYLRQHCDAEIRLVGCQKVCEEPAAGLRVNGRMEWFGRLDSPARLKALAALLRGSGKAGLPGALEKVRSSKRSGRSPR